MAVRVESVVIAISGTESAALSLNPNERVVAVQTPSAITAANLSFLVNIDGTNYLPVQNEDAAYAKALVIDLVFTIPAIISQALRGRVKLKTSVAQGAARTFQVVIVSSD